MDIDPLVIPWLRGRPEILVADVGDGLCAAVCWLPPDGIEVDCGSQVGDGLPGAAGTVSLASGKPKRTNLLSCA